MSDKVKVEYQTEQDHCSCCGHELERPKTSGTREFYFSKDDCLAWLNQDGWKMESTDKDSFQELVYEFVWSTIDFFAVSSYEVIHIEKSEFNKVKQFILENIVS